MYGSALPDFMVWNQVKELPFFWKPFYSAGFALAGAILIPTLFGTILWFSCFPEPEQGRLLCHYHAGVGALGQAGVQSR